jgi:hypothetical protein
MLIDRRCRLCTAVAVHAVEIEGGHPMLAEGTLNVCRHSSIWLCNISHLHGSPYYLSGYSGNRSATLGQNNVCYYGVYQRVAIRSGMRAAELKHMLFAYPTSGSSMTRML